MMMGRTDSPLPPFCCSVFIFEPFRVSGRQLTMAALVSIGIGLWLGHFVGAKSHNIAYLKGKVPSWVVIPTSVALPFGSFEKVLSDEFSQFDALEEIRKTVLEIVAPPQLVQELKEKMQSSGMPWPGDEGRHRWEQAWIALKFMNFFVLLSLSKEVFHFVYNDN
ncbi:putative alpha-glucan, water dikinase [Helianthus annuus]|uniref:Alpha-glucan, water dikinase n=1 Tax=Helianthus annuus TaxID=4232 RepID=A0A9K3DJD6_HELAN|nr:putative alpha-glucan, water dikinase [Helianthus annuus]KAJ0428823.1 putative alpha-glucan, water dikinase [Helianthus annuus]KAJ0447153.1 putative alpha-glucan, water dikinase [Helianthus annuus]KAJ0632061.1 putative alpha-glucan, water dikinase [Helianthus annuus]KAJ0812761.1 putative alpha-glucan, water dikinase [Helianthus annuus]